MYKPLTPCLHTYINVNISIKKAKIAPLIVDIIFLLRFDVVVFNWIIIYYDNIIKKKSTFYRQF